MHLFDLAWPPDRLPEAIAFVALKHGFARRFAPEHTDIETIADQAGLEAEKVRVVYRDVDRVLVASAPAIFRVEDRLVVLLRNRGSRSIFLDTDLREVHLARAAVASTLREVVHASRGQAIDRFLATVESHRGHRELRLRLIGERFGEDEVGQCWLIRKSASDSLGSHLVDAGAVRYALALATTHLIRYVIFVAAWAVIGRAALEGTPDSAWIVAWLLLLLMLVPVHYVATSLQGLIALACGFVLRQRLLYGSLRLDPEQLRSDGAGRHLARVFEGDAVEALGRSGGLLAFFALIELTLAGFVLAAGAGGVLHAILLISWIVFIIFVALLFSRRYDAWTAERMSLTSDLVERMVGHRTRLVQQRRTSWHEDEDRQLETYAAASRDVDRAAIWVTALIPRGWMVVALLGLAPGILSGDRTPAALAVSLGGTVLTLQAMKRLATGLPDLIGAAAAWKKISPLSRAASQPREMPAIAGAPATADDTVIDAQGISFQHRHRSEPVLRGCSIRLERGDRVLLQGSSGSGKSTLASLLVGARRAGAGLLLLEGYDRATLGCGAWRRRAVLAPQFHENHVLSESFAFNLLMGRGWPPNPDDWHDAEELCDELGLGPLLAQMPGGLSQMLGESGWRLSHGEQSRLFIARALLQKASLVVLDESFAALDPETLQRTVECVIRRAPALLVIAHP